VKRVVQIKLENMNKQQDNKTRKTKNKKSFAGRQAGFTIIETLVAVLILTLSITGPMVFVNSSLRSAFLSRDQITAFYLAQDAIETIKNIRDENALQNNYWLEGIILADCPSNDYCLIKVNTVSDPPIVEKCNGTDCGPLNLDSNGRFVHDLSEEDSRFTRNIYVREFTKEAQIIVEVKWESNVRIGRTRIVVQENITNWIPNSDYNSND
jgi:type II secretory pathway pseudopilin PulG